MQTCPTGPAWANTGNQSGLFDERVGVFTIAGALLIVGGCIAASRGKRPVAPEIEAAA